MSDALVSDVASPFHKGEKTIQTKMGVGDTERWARKFIRDHMPVQHRVFFTAQPFLVVSARDEAGRPWATLLEGEDGFVTSPEATVLDIESKPARGDALETAFSSGTDVGILGIELATRRRNRVNGRVDAVKKNAISFAVDQSFGNCPQYIRERNYWRSPEDPSGKSVKGSQLSEAQRAWIGSADTFFIASGFRGDGENPAYGMDVSHRGGERGFVEVLSDTTIRFPDYAGNNHYNTLGNLLLNPQAGFLFIDFATGSLLQLTGKATIDWDSDDVAKFHGARQLVSLEIEEIVELPSALKLRWDEDAETARSLRLIEKKQESADVTSFVFESRDGGPLEAFEAGQHLPIELDIPGVDGKVQRSYSLSGAPGENRYRISVKREPRGLASTFLHDRLEEGAILASRKPSGGFGLPDTEPPLVLVSAGIGVTPMLSYLHAASSETSDRPIWFVHGARDGAHHPFKDEVRRLVAAQPNINAHTLYSRPLPEDVSGVDYDTKGRITADFLADLVSRKDAHFLLCGPAAFMAEIKSDLEDRNISEDRIHIENFGPAG
jgi:uncharacterized protein